MGDDFQWRGGSNSFSTAAAWDDFTTDQSPAPNPPGSGDTASTGDGSGSISGDGDVNILNIQGDYTFTGNVTAETDIGVDFNDNSGVATVSGGSLDGKTSVGITNGTLNIVKGGSVVANTGSSSAGSILNFSTISVNGGTLSAFAIGDGGSLTLTSGQANATLFSVGSSGTPASTLDIGSGSTISDSSANIGLATTDNSSATVEAGGVWTNSSNLVMGIGHATLDIEAGGSVEILGTAGPTVEPLSVGFAGGNGIVDVSGGTLSVTGDGEIGGSGPGTLAVSNSGSVMLTGSLTLGGIAAGKGTVTVAEGSDLEVDGNLTVAASGSGSLDSNGGSLTIGGGTLTIASAPNSNGDVTFGNGSLELTALTDGGAGNGTFSANSNANVTVTNLVVGASTDGTGAFSLDGKGSQVQASNLTIGASGVGGVQLTNGALLQVAGGAVMGSGSVPTAQGATIETNADWTIGSLLNVGQSGNAGITIDSGGHVGAGSVVLGDKSGATGTISATGTGTLPSSLAFGVMQVGNFGSGALTLAQGAQAGADTTSGTVEIAATAGAQGLVSLTGAQTMLQAQLLAVGGSGSAAGGAGTLSIGAGATVAVSAATIWNSGTVQLAGGVLVTDPASVFGTIFGAGTVGGAITDNGEITASGGTLVLSGAIGGSGTLTVGSAAEMSLQSTVAVAVGMAGVGSTLQLGALENLQAGITKFGSGDTIIVDGLSADGASFSAGTLTLTEGQTTVGTIALSGPANGQLFTASVSSGNTTITELACFAAGTRIATDRGQVEIEALRAGDRIVAMSGRILPVLWIGYRHLDCRHHPSPRQVLPVRIRAHAFGADTPCRELRLSPDHAVSVQGALIPVRHLLNGVTIVQEATEQVTYFHLELPSHAVILADGMPAESYLDTGNRGALGSVRLGAGPVHDLNQPRQPRPAAG